MTVTGFSWERSVRIEQYTTVQEEDWSIPAGGRHVSERREVKYYEDVLDYYETRTREVSEQVQTGTHTYVCGSRDLGNGYFEDIECTEPVYETRYRTESYQEPVYRSEPVYGTKYTYLIDKWVFSRQPSSSGTNRSATWPEFGLNGNEREAGRTQKYIVKLTDDEGNTQPLELSFDQWQTLHEGQKVGTQVNGFGVVTGISESK